jgi:hypothetical protein
MTTTRYVTGDGIGALTLLARAVDPNGSPIVQQTTITVNPSPVVSKCYSAVLALSTVQSSIETACAQFGALGTYYLGSPTATVYSTDSCSEVAVDGFYKTEDGNWININAGAISQRGSCATLAQRVVERRPQEFNIGGITNTVNSVPPIAVRIPGTPDRGEDFVRKPSFTNPSPSLTPVKEQFVNVRQSETVPQRLPEQSVARVKELAPTNVDELISRARSLGLSVSQDTVTTITSFRGGPKKQALFVRLRQQVQAAIDKAERQSVSGGVVVSETNQTIPDTNTEL